MEKIKTLIIDDEKEAREGLYILIDKDPEIDIKGTAKNGIEAIKLISEVQPDLIFLDIQMPGVNGFEVLNSVDVNPMPFVIFVTAFDEYALKAFEVHALDYLLKPFSDERFFDALDKAKKQIRANQVQQMNSKVEELIVDYVSRIHYELGAEWMNNKREVEDRFLIKHSGKVIFIDLKDLIWIEADGYYIKLHTTDKSYLVRKSMKQAEKLLPSRLFMRVHKSSIINKRYIKEIEPHFNGEYYISLNNGSSVKVSRSYKDVVKDFIEQKKL